MKHLSACFLPLALLSSAHAQLLVDSIPFPGISQGFWGIYVNGDTVFLGADFSGDIYFSDHSGNILGQLPTGHPFDHGFIRRASSYLIAQDYTTNGAHLYEIDLAGNPLNSWTFPDVLGGHSSGIGDLWDDGGAIWYTMYYPDFPNYPYAYAYKWTPGDPTASDTVPLWGEQPYGIAIKGDTLFYVTDNLNGDQERIYAYDLTNEQDIGWVELPDTPIDNDQSPRGMFYDGQYLYLIANRQGGNAFAYQTVFIYSFDGATWVKPTPAHDAFGIHPSPADETAFIGGLAPGTRVLVTDASGRVVERMTASSVQLRLNASVLTNGVYLVTIQRPDGTTASRRLCVTH